MYTTNLIDNFNGTLQGNGYTVTYTISRQSIVASMAFGLFGDIKENGIIRT